MEFVFFVIACFAIGMVARLFWTAYRVLHPKPEPMAVESIGGGGSSASISGRRGSYEATIVRGDVRRTYRSDHGITWYAEDGSRPSYDMERALEQKIRSQELWEGGP